MLKKLADFRQILAEIRQIKNLAEIRQKLADFRQILADFRQIKKLADFRQKLAETWQTIKIMIIKKKKRCLIRGKTARNLQLRIWKKNNITADHLQKHCRHLKGSSDQH